MFCKGLPVCPSVCLRVATGGARTTENCVATGGAKRNDAMKSNGTKGSPLAAPELSQKSVTKQKTDSPQAVPRDMKRRNEKN